MDAPASYRGPSSSCCCPGSISSSAVDRCDVGTAFLRPNSGGKMFRAYDKATGDVVWEMELPGGVTSAPMTCMAGGKQYIVVVVGWDDMPSEYVALALP